jgi:hypothetical protein
MQRKIGEAVLMILLVVASLTASLLFMILPFRALDTGLVYMGF